MEQDTFGESKREVLEQLDIEKRIYGLNYLRPKFRRLLQKWDVIRGIDWNNIVTFEFVLGKEREYATVIYYDKYNKKICEEDLNEIIRIRIQKMTKSSAKSYTIKEPLNGEQGL